MGLFERWTRLWIFAALLVGTIMPCVITEGDVHDIGFFMPWRKGITSDASGINTKSGDTLWRAGKDISIPTSAPNIEHLFPLLYGDQIGTIEITPLALNFSLWREHSKYLRMFDGRKQEGFGQRGVEKFVKHVNAQISGRRIPAVYPARADSPEDRTILASSTVRNPPTTRMVNIGPIACDHREFIGIGAFPCGSGAFFRGISRFLSRVGGDLGVVQAFANENELPEKKEKLNTGNTDQTQRKKSYGIARDPVPDAFVWLTCVVFGCGCLIGGGAGWAVYRFGGRRDKAPASGKPNYRPEKRPE